MEPIRSYCSASVGLPLLAVGRLLHYTFRGLLSVYSRYGLHARQVAYATLYTRGSDDFVSSVAALIATGWSEPAPGRDFHPLRTSAFHGAPQAVGEGGESIQPRRGERTGVTQTLQPQRSQTTI